MKKIELKKDVIYTLVDNEDYKRLSLHKWTFTGGYAVRCTKDNVKVFMHREVMDCPKDKFVDHINNNRLDNRKENLRICTHEENMKNVSLRSNNTSGYKGVYYKKSRKTRNWCARSKYGNKVYFLGYFDNPVDAAKAYDTFIVSIGSEFSKTNKGLGLI